MYIDNLNIYVCDNSSVFFDLENLKVINLTDKLYKKIKSGNLEDIYEYRKKVGKIQNEKLKVCIKGIKINVSHLCNLACTYCYASEGEYNSKGLMSEEVMERLADVIENCFPDIECISFFGGEPTLNYDAIQYFCERFEGLEFLLQTNGMLLQDKKIQKLIKDYNIKVTLSVDGNKEMHDKHRKMKNNQPTYDIIKKNVNNSRDNGIEIAAAQVTCTDLKYSKKKLAKTIYDDFGIKNIYVKNVLNKDLLKDGISVDTNYMSEILEEIDAIEENKEFLMSQEMKKILMPILSKTRDADYFCEACRKILSIDINGNIWPCHLGVGQGEEICNILESEYSAILESINTRAAEMHLKNKNSYKYCEKCIARYHCIRCFQYTDGDSYYENICNRKKSDTKIVLEWFGKNLDYIDVFRKLIGGNP